LTWLALLLAGVAGGVDAIGWLTLDGIFVAHMSGNTVGVTTHVALGEPSEVARRAFAIVAFVVGLAVGAASSAVARRRAPQTGFSVALAVEAALLLAMMLGGRAASHGSHAVPRQPWMPYYALIGAGAVAMGIQGTTLRRVRSARVRTTYITGLLTRLVEGLVKLATLAPGRRHAARTPEADDEWRKTTDNVRVLSAVWIAYTAGGISSGVLTIKLGFSAIALPLATLVAAILLDWRLAHEGTAEAGAREE
jgi:uncharacterized membrane protein YoaK (UPF0700 family)